MLLSLGLHAVTYAALGAVSLDDAARAPQDIVELSVVQEPPPTEAPPEPEAAEPEPAPPAPPPEPAKAPPKPVARAPKPAKTPPPPDDTPPAAAEEQIADFSGTTLTGQGGWASAVGTGGAMDAPIGSANAVTTGRDRAGTPGGVVGGTGTRVVAAGDLSRQPVPPSADIANKALEQTYPKSARQQGLEGVARIRVRVMPSGKLQVLANVTETQPGFADACRKSLRELQFQPGLDRAGQPVATDITYVCRFTID